MKRVYFVFCLLLGTVGTLGCAVLSSTVWLVDARLNQTTRTIFHGLDEAAIAIRERIDSVQDRVDESRTASLDLREKFEAWSKQEVGERLSERLEVDQRAQRLSDLLQQADGWLGTSTASLEVVQSGLDVAKSAGVSVETDAIPRLLEQISQLQSQVQEANQIVVEFQDRIAGDDDDGSVRERLERARTLLLRIPAVLDRVEARLGELDEMLDAARRELKDAEGNCLRMIHLVALGVTLLLIWMLAGQFALARYGWKNLRERKATYV